MRKIFPIILFALLFPGISNAAEAVLPETMVGQTKVEVQGMNVDGITAIQFCGTVETNNPVTFDFVNGNKSYGSCSGFITPDTNEGVWHNVSNVEGYLDGNHRSGLNKIAFGFETVRSISSKPITKIILDIGAGDPLSSSSNPPSAGMNTFRWTDQPIVITANTAYSTQYAKGTNADPAVGTISHLNIRFQVFSEYGATPIKDMGLVSTILDNGGEYKKSSVVYGPGTGKHFTPVNNGDGIGDVLAAAMTVDARAGQPTTSRTYYGALIGGESVFNYLNDNGQTLSVATTGSNPYGYEPFGFEQTTLNQCLLGIIVGTSPSRCFVPNSQENNVEVMNSRTYSGYQTIETAVLLYPQKSLIAGNAHLGAANLDNFAYWGRNIVSTEGSTFGSEAFISIGGYKTSTASQATLDTSSVEYQNYLDKTNILFGEGKSVPANGLSGTVWGLQAKDQFNSTLKDDAPIFPDGKVWKISGDVNIAPNTTITYNGIGTVIIDGNLSIGSGVKIRSLNSGDRLGIIVINSHDVSFGGGNTIDLALFDDGIVTIGGSNSEFIGSFVGRDFNFGGGSNNRFYYDKNLDDGWPPGFRDLNMPHQN